MEDSVAAPTRCRRRGRGSYNQTQASGREPTRTRPRHELTSATTRVYLNRGTRNDEYGREAATMDGIGRETSTTDRRDKEHGVTERERERQGTGEKASCRKEIEVTEGRSQSSVPSLTARQSEASRDFRRGLKVLLKSSSVDTIQVS